MWRLRYLSLTMKGMVWFFFNPLRCFYIIFVCFPSGSPDFIGMPVWDCNDVIWEIPRFPVQERIPAMARNKQLVSQHYICTQRLQRNMFLIILTFCLSGAELTLAGDSRLENIGLRCAALLCWLCCLVSERDTIRGRISASAISVKVIASQKASLTWDKGSRITSFFPCFFQNVFNNWNDCVFSFNGLEYIRSVCL